jgi:hypothetical protein
MAKPKANSKTIVPKLASEYSPIHAKANTAKTKTSVSGVRKRRFGAYVNQ